MRTRAADIEWIGDLENGGGQVSGRSGSFAETPFGFGSRFLDEPGTNPEELLAAAHGSCMAMYLSLLLTRNGTPPEEMEVTASVGLLNADEDRVDVSASRIKITCKVANLGESRFQELVREAVADCPISRALKTRATRTAELV